MMMMTLDHATIIDRLRHTFGIESSAIDWLTSYLTNRSQFVKFGDVLSPPTHCSIGVPQGSVLGPILFSLFISPVAGVISNFGVSFHQFADDTQLYIGIDPKSIVESLDSGHPGQMQSCGPRLVHKQWPGTQPIEVRSSLHGHQNETTFSREHRQGISDRMWYIASWEHQKSWSDTGLGTLSVQTCQQHLQNITLPHPSPSTYPTISGLRDREDNWMRHRRITPGLLQQHPVWYFSRKFEEASDCAECSS